MKFLTIDVSANVTVGVCEAADGKVKQLSVAQSADGRHHVEVLSPLVSKVLAEAQVKVPDAIVAGTGPAAFTGLRAGLVTARTLAAAWNIPLYGLSSPEILARAAADKGADVTVPIIDARRKEIYTLRARPLGADDVEVTEPVRVIAPGVLAAELKENDAVVAAQTQDLYADLFPVRMIVSASPAVMTRLALSRLARIDAGERLSLDARAQYLRRPDVHGGGSCAQAPAVGNPYR